MDSMVSLSDSKIEPYSSTADGSRVSGLILTCIDLARFAIELQEARAGRSHKVLSQDLARETLTPQYGQSGPGIMIAGAGEAARFQRGGRNAGFRCQLEATLETGQGAVVMTNSDAGAALAQEMLRSIARAYGRPAIKADK